MQHHPDQKVDEGPGSSWVADPCCERSKWQPGCRWNIDIKPSKKTSKKGP
jgi:hypothetical protein